ncbi:hypothetical protein [Agrobacterium pusense]|uniref:hypothetical protein n=1 Tax=Agrobacterium pusense TaxID=648995 RepID=UPI00345E0838
MQDDTIYPFLAASLEIFANMSRRTGRTSAMLERLQPGDCVVVATGDERQHMKRELHQRNIVDKVAVVVFNPKTLEAPNHLRPPYRAVHFDNFWWEKYYAHALRSVAERPLHLAAHLAPTAPRVSLPEDGPYRTLAGFELRLRNADEGKA